MENRPVDNQNLRPRNSGKDRIKNITRDVEARQFDPDIDSILPKTDWNERMANARTSSARMKAASLKSNGAAAGNKQRISPENGGRPRSSETADVSRRSRYSEPEGNARRPRYSEMADNGGRSHSSQTSQSRQRARMQRPSTASQLSREFEEDDKKRRMKNAGHKKRVSLPAKIMAVVLVFAVIAGSVFLITNYGAGTQSNKKGNRYYRNGEYASAVTMYQKALSYDSHNSEYNTNLGMAYIALSQYDDALQAFDDAVKNTKRGELLQRAKRGSGIVYLYQGHYTKAQELLTEALEYGGGTYGEAEIDILYYLAEAQDRSGDAVGAVLSYTQIIEHQADANAYMLRGLAYQRVGDNTKAESDLETAISMSKKNYKTYLALYEVLMAQGKEEDARATLDKAINLGGKTGEDYSNLGIVYMYMQDYSKAEQAFNTALERGYNGAYLGLAESLIRQNDYAGAQTQYESFIAVDKTNATAYNQYGLCLMELSKYEEAAAAFASGLAINDRLVDRQLMYNEAVVYEFMADWTTAYEKMKAFVEKYPDDEKAQHELTFLESRQ